MEYNIELSDTCIALLKINDTTCPSYDQILTVFPDQSNQKYSGKFGYEDNYFHRLRSDYKEQYGFYRYDSNDRLWVDAPPDVKPIKRIVIASRNFEYVIPKQKVDTTFNNTLSVGQNRFISSGCSYAIITKDNWIFLLGDTIRYMMNGCKSEFTTFTEEKIIDWTRNYHDITTSAKYKLEQWQKKAIEDCAGKVCIPK